MKQSVSAGWAVGAIALILLLVAGFYLLGTRTKPLHARPVQSMGKAMPAQQFVPTYKGP